MRRGTVRGLRRRAWDMCEVKALLLGVRIRGSVTSYDDMMIRQSCGGCKDVSTSFVSE